eukprot:6780986-Pyramimonas_sp.AAC.1
MTFRHGAAASLESIGPRQLLELCDGALGALTDILMEVERASGWPSPTTKVCFLAKRLGGARPIAIIMVLARAHARPRRSIALGWGKRSGRPFFWAARGRGCERAAWQQAAECEWATAKGRQQRDPEAWVSVLAMLDLLKACEKVRHHHLVETAVRTGFPLWQLKSQID